MLKDKELTSLHDSLFAKFKDYALSKEEMRQVRGGKTTTCSIRLTDGTIINGVSGISDPNQAAMALTQQYLTIDEASGANGSFFDGSPGSVVCE